MAELQDKLKIAKEFFNALFAPAPAVPAAAPVAPVAASPAYSLADGTPVNITNLQPGGTITVVGESGEVPAPAGEHTLADGTVLVVAEGGVISEIKPAAAPPLDPMDEMKKNIEEMKADFENRLSQMQSGMQTQFSEQAKKYQEGIEKLIEVCESFATEPAATPDPEVARRPTFNTKPAPAAERFKAVSNILFKKK